MKRLPSSQLEIMQSIWTHNKPITRKELHLILSNKNWKITTLNTLLNRLVQNGFLEVGYLGKQYVYTAIITKNDYLVYESKYALSAVFGDSIESFFSAICNVRDMTTDEIEDLQQYLEKLKERDSND